MGALPADLQNPAIMRQSKYWDLDDIQAEEEAVTVHLETDLPGFGHLHGSSLEADLKRGQKAIVPWWFATALEKVQAGSLEQPRHYGEQFNNTLIADATIVNLFEKGEFYYEMGAKLAVGDTALRETLCKTLSTRFYYILDHTSAELDHRVHRKLTNIERGVYEKGRKGYKEQYEWRSGQLARVAQSSSMSKVKRMRLIA